MQVLNCINSYRVFLWWYNVHFLTDIIILQCQKFYCEKNTKILSACQCKHVKSFEIVKTDILQILKSYIWKKVDK